jgi:maleate isomerase
MDEANLHVLLVVPDQNTRLEAEIGAYCPSVSKITMARVPRPQRASTVADIPAYVAQSLATVDAIGARGVDLVMYGCTSAGFLAGPAEDSNVATKLHKAVGAPVVTTASSTVEALSGARMKRIAVVTPYVDATNACLVDYLRSGNIEVVAINSFRSSTIDELSQITPKQVFDMALATMTDACDGLFIGCVQLSTIGILPELRARLQRPVWSAAQALAWSGMRILNRSTKGIEGVA